MNDDATLLRRYAEEKSEAAFAELVRRHLDSVYSAALRRLGGDGHRAADVAQQVFTALARDARTLSRHAVLSAWLYTATRNAAIDFIRSEQRRRVREHEASTVQTLMTSTPDADWEKLRPVLDAAMDELSDADRTAVLMRYFQQCAFAEIGAALRLSDDAARMRVERALKKLQAALLRRGVASSSGVLGLALDAHARAPAPTGLVGSVTTKAIASGTLTATTIETVGLMGGLKLAGGVAAALLIFAALGTGAYAVHARKVAEEGLFAERSAYDALDTAILTAKTRALAAEKSAAELKRELGAARTARAVRESSSVATTEESKPAFDPDAAGDAFLAKHPEVKETLADYARARVNYNYGALYQKLGFSPTQIARFQELAFRAGMGSDTTDGNEMQLHWPREILTDGGRELKELLGEQGLSLFTELNHQEESRTMTAHVAGALWFSETPLTPTQAEQLASVFQSSRPKSRGGNYASVDWDAAIARAGEFLSAPQLAVLEGEKAHEQLDAALNRAMSSAVATPAK